MGSILIYKGMPPLTAEQEARLAALKDMSDDDIVFDEECPPLTDEQLSRMKRVPPERRWHKITLDIDDEVIQAAARRARG